MTKPRMSLYELEFALYDLLQTVLHLVLIFQLDSVAGVPAGSPAVQLQEEVGE